MNNHQFGEVRRYKPVYRSPFRLHDVSHSLHVCLAVLPLLPEPLLRLLDLVSLSGE